MIFVTGGAGFIGSNFVLKWIKEKKEDLLNIDKLTYAGNLENLSTLKNQTSYQFVQGDIGDSEFMFQLYEKHKPRALINFAAESHVDRSIHGPSAFIQTNVVGTFHLLEATRKYFDGLKGQEKEKFRFFHISTDEVYGSLELSDPPFREQNPYQPNSPYSASKASSDHLVRAYHHTYGLPTLTTNCSNNYGPYQFPEKLIPLMIHQALKGKALPIYGDGSNVRDWLFVEDHCSAIMEVLERGRQGEVYNVGGKNEVKNIDVVKEICGILDLEKPRQGGGSYLSQMTFVKDRLGHDKRYAIDFSKIEKELDWKPKETFQSGLIKTIRWYLSHPEWTEHIVTGQYQSWMQTNYTDTERI